MTHKLQIRVYYEDTDAGGIVYHSNYLKFMERGRTEMLRKEGFESSKSADSGFIFVVAGLKIDYRKPAKLDDLLEVRTSVIEAKGVKVVLQQDVYRNDTLLTESTLTLVLIDEAGKPAKIGQDVIDKLTSLQRKV